MVNASTHRATHLSRLATWAVLSGLLGALPVSISIGLKFANPRLGAYAGLAAFIGFAGMALLLSFPHYFSLQKRLTSVAVDDDRFLDECHIDDDPRHRTFALAVRKILADFAEVPVHNVYADDAHDDSLWDSIDWLDVLLQIEQATGEQLPRESLIEKSLQLASHDSHMRVRHIVQAAIALADEARQSPIPHNRFFSQIHMDV